ncbi:MAG TPA: non-homologous end-joining DNA ligase [Polyangiaceae bacterium]|jgi:bifunctional non-homologous end joining protein LigD
MFRSEPPRTHRPSSAPPLATYRAKRKFNETPEPRGSRKRRLGAAPRFVVQKHDASHLHYDFRLEIGGVLKSWAVPKGPTLDSSEKRLAMAVEDHPLDYYDFEGVIPKGSYGAGEVIVWDWGTFEVEGDDAERALAKGRLTFRLRGEKLAGTFTLVKIHPRTGKKDSTWLLLKRNDRDAEPGWRADDHGESVKSGRSLDELRAPAKKAPRTKRARATVPKTTAPRRKRSGRAPDPLPRTVHPELATLIDAPFDDDGWLFEIKWDGFRAVTTVGPRGEVTMTSRNGKDLLARFPTLASIGRSFSGVPVIVDGEIVATDERGHTSFQRLQNGANAKISYAVFDLLYAQGHDLRSKPLEERKALLVRLVDRNAKNVILSSHVNGEGKRLFEAARAEGLEGIVGKRRSAPYVEGRTRDWVKIKAQLEQECVIAGFTEPGGARSGFGSLVLGLYEHGELVYCGNVGTGFAQATLASLFRRLKKLETRTCPFATRPATRTPAHWVAPALVAQIRFTEWTRDGSMRHPAFLGLRDDKNPRQCHRERPREVSEVA